jgi:hypothetical protein
MENYKKETVILEKMTVGQLAKTFPAPIQNPQRYYSAHNSRSMTPTLLLLQPVHNLTL